jgi:hypothetical protein
VAETIPASPQLLQNIQLLDVLTQTLVITIQMQNLMTDLVFILTIAESVGEITLVMVVWILTPATMTLMH